MITVLSKAVVGPLFCDKLSVTLPVLQKKEQTHIESCFKDLVNQKHAYSTTTPFYRDSIRFRAGGGKSDQILLQAAPRFETVAFFRCEFNPTVVEPAIIRAVFDAVLPKGYEHLMWVGKCTRIDLTTDIYGVDVDDLLIWSKNARVSRVFCRNGKVETLYLGSKLSPIGYAIYDKNAEQLKKGSSKDMNGPRTRIEVRVKTAISTSSLGALANPFSKLNVACYKSFTGMDEMSAMFLDSCRYRGAHAALKQLNKKKRERFEFLLRTHKSPWWDPYLIWQQYPTVVEQLQNSQAPKIDYEESHSNFGAIELH
ncbi:MAG: replication initiation factor domain-containing protein [Proteobacteria bacterium]|nr:replication initiation factor domain-containing protein [Pseudomonadota bacterium]MCH7920541.1 replication initiation factor domain-containing protein [Planctomycetota bacterium]